MLQKCRWLNAAGRLLVWNDEEMVGTALVKKKWRSREVLALLDSGHKLKENDPMFEKVVCKIDEMLKKGFINEEKVVFVFHLIY